MLLKIPLCSPNDVQRAVNDALIPRLNLFGTAGKLFLKYYKKIWFSQRINSMINSWNHYNAEIKITNFNESRHANLNSSNLVPLKPSVVKWMKTVRTLDNTYYLEYLLKLKNNRNNEDSSNESIVDYNNYSNLMEWLITD